MTRKIRIKSCLRLVAVWGLFSAIILSNNSVYGVGPYTDKSNTVIDNATDLEWQKSDNAMMYDWQQSLDYCRNLHLDGIGWRLPNSRELDSIVDLSQSSPSIDAVFSCQSAGYWSATTYDPDPRYAWSTDFTEGFDNISDKVNARHYVRCVRAKTSTASLGSITGGAANVPVQNDVWLLGSFLAGFYFLCRRRI